ncbi:hypothetical protein GALL_428320 [mine drainage metagenome]|uniref:Uncharacterized protein n=1 Tax=mine drainage metagenome TaxID=410659 RepID=A0A1J5PV89_9ZZZZ
MQLLGLRAGHVLHREAEIGGIDFSRDRCRFQFFQQGLALVPGHAFAAGDHHVALQRRNGNEGEFAADEAETGVEVVEVALDLVKDFLRVVHQVHLVDGHHDVRDAKQARNVGVAAGLRQHALARIDQDDGQVRGRGSRHHIAGVLLVPRRVGNDEFSPGGGEVAVGHVDGDALFALGLQAVGEQRQVRALGALFVFHVEGGVELILEHPLGVDQKASDQGGFAVIHAASGGEAQQRGFGGRKQVFVEYIHII